MILLLSCLSESPIPAAAHKFPKIQLEANSTSYTVEHAEKPHEVALGLRYRILKPNEGILLNLQGRKENSYLSMTHMRSPISAALIDSEHVIQEIWPLPLSSSEKNIPPYVQFIWEMPQGWFKKERIQINTPITGIPRTP